MFTGITDAEIELILRGTQRWMTPYLLRYTITTFQPYYLESRTAADAVEMLHNVGMEGPWNLIGCV